MIIIARLNDRAQPLDRGDLYEDPLDYVLQESGKGRVTGGGTQMHPSGEIDFCEIEIELTDASQDTYDLIKTALEKMGAPKGSKLLLGKEAGEAPFGTLEGLAVYLNGTDLPPSTYEECDVNIVYQEFEARLEGIGSVHSYWEGASETALYMYGASFERMKAALADFMQTYPLCEKARVVQIA